MSLIARWMAVTCLLAAAACGVDHDDGGFDGPPPDEVPPTIANPDFEHVTFSADEFQGGGLEIGPDQAWADPCLCADYACLQDWANEVFGCSICVGLICSGEAGPHVCTSTCE